MEYLISTKVLEAALPALDGEVAAMIRSEIARRESEAAQRDKAAMS